MHPTPAAQQNESRKAQQKIQLTIKCTNGSVFDISINSFETVINLKKGIKVEQNIRSRYQTLYYDYKELTDLDSRTRCDVEDMATIYLRLSN